MIEVGDSNFEAEVLGSDVPVIVDFWADWCGPCKLIAPKLEELAYEYRGRFKFTKVNADDNPMTSVNYGVRSLPTQLIFKAGSQVDFLAGDVTKEELKKRIEAVLA